MLTALLVSCPSCGARAGQSCNAPTETGRRDVRWVHLSREDRAARELPTRFERRVQEDWL